MSELVCTRRDLMAGLAAIPLATALPGAALGKPKVKTIGAIERLDPALDAIVDPKSPIELLATGFQWAEGPVWVREGAGGYLLFNDVPQNTMWRWTKRGAAKFMAPSGLAGPIPPELREAGANGMAMDAAGHLIMADSGSRAIARVDLKTKAKTILAATYQGKRFNSPNDVAVARSGAIYFTDPPYGHRDGDASTIRELDFNGLFRLDPDGTVTMLERIHKRPNGVALSPDQKTLYVALSDEAKPVLLAYDLDAKGMPLRWRVFSDMAAQLAAGRPGLPDGVKVAADGTIFATGPGGVHVLTPAGKLLGIIGTGDATANCAFGEDGKSLFLTSHTNLARVRLKIGGW